MSSSVTKSADDDGIAMGSLEAAPDVTESKVAKPSASIPWFQQQSENKLASDFPE